MLNKSKVSVPVIFHGFNKSTELSRKILAEGWYLSFGKNLIDNVAVQEVFTATPIDKLFLETDAAEIDIETIYRSAAKLREVDLKELAGQIEKNIIKVFGEKTISEHE
jgi:TatD DNase family protein